MAFSMDLVAIGSYFGFDALSTMNIALVNHQSEIIINEGGFHTFMLLIVLAFHVLITFYAHTPNIKKALKEKVFLTGSILTFLPIFFSGYLVSTYVENKLENSGYQFCENLSYEKRYLSTHYVWRAKNISCD